MGLTGAVGLQGPAGAGLVARGYLSLPAGTPPPAGYTKIGTSDVSYKDAQGRPQKIDVDVYQKN